HSPRSGAASASSMLRPRGREMHHKSVRHILIISQWTIDKNEQNNVSLPPAKAGFGGPIGAAIVTRRNRAFACVFPSPRSQQFLASIVSFSQSPSNIKNKRRIRR